MAVAAKVRQKKSYDRHRRRGDRRFAVWLPESAAALAEALARSQGFKSPSALIRAAVLRELRELAALKPKGADLFEVAPAAPLLDWLSGVDATAEDREGVALLDDAEGASRPPPTIPQGDGPR